MLNAPSQWEEDRQPVESRSAQARHSPSNRPPASPIRIRQRNSQRTRNPFPPVIVIGDDDDVEDAHRLDTSSTTSITRMRVEKTRITRHKRRQDGERRAETEGPSTRQQA
jgi:hypothetical protein